jgi:hypothetical protein
MEAAIRSKNNLDELASSIDTIKGLTGVIARFIRQSVPRKRSAIIHQQ